MSKARVTSTECVQAAAGKHHGTHAITPPIVHSAPFCFDDTKDLIDFMEGRSERKQAEYGRMTNPTVTAVEEKLAALEGAEKAQLFSSGMAAVTSLFFTLLQSGDHIILTSDSYRRTRDFGFFLGKFGVKMDIVNPFAKAIEDAVQPSTRLIFSEIPTNPYLHFIDLHEVVEIARKNNLLVVADSTFATPCNLKPLEIGVNLVIHSATKYLGGHNDLIAGVLAGSDELVQPVTEMLMTLGSICDPNTAFLLGRGLKTLGVRVAKQNASGQAVAEFLEKHPRIQRVYYPGLGSHPSHNLAKNLMHGYGGVVTFLVDGSFDDTSTFVDHLKIPQIAPSLGGVDSLVEQVAIMSFWNLPKPEREALGIPDNLVRLAIGIEEAEDLIADLDQALKAG